jgi:uncharacterized membrane protein YidH (DUF202 family)
MTFSDLVGNIVEVLQVLIYLIIGIAVLGFLWGLVGYLANSDSEEKRKDSINYMVAGIIGLLVMVGIWGIVNLILGTFGITGGIPQIS